MLLNAIFLHKLGAQLAGLVLISRRAPLKSLQLYTRCQQARITLTFCEYMNGFISIF